MSGPRLLAANADVRWLLASLGSADHLWQESASMEVDTTAYAVAGWAWRRVTSRTTGAASRWASGPAL
jgi:hypothetical protein